MNGHQIKKLVAKYYQIDLDSKSRLPRNVVPRQIAQYLCRRYTSLSKKQIGCIFGNSDPTTILSNIRRIDSLLLKDVGIASDIRALGAVIELEMENKL